MTRGKQSKRAAPLAFVLPFSGIYIYRYIHVFEYVYTVFVCRLGCECVIIWSLYRWLFAQIFKTHVQVYM